jgi:hypothetical protein
MIGKRNATLLAGALVVALAAAALYLTGIAEIPFYTKGEPREALVVWEMSHGASHVLPLRNGTELPSEPPPTTGSRCSRRSPWERCPELAAAAVGVARDRRGHLLFAATTDSCARAGSPRSRHVQLRGCARRARARRHDMTFFICSPWSASRS